jgi:hypothetical protein
MEAEHPALSFSWLCAGFVGCSCPICVELFRDGRAKEELQAL